MVVDVNGKEYHFELNGFAPLYAYEVIMGEPFVGSSTRNVHVMIYATLLASNAGKLNLSMDEFSAWLYDHPNEEQAMAQVVFDEFARRASLVGKKKE